MTWQETAGEGDTSEWVRDLRRPWWRWVHVADRSDGDVLAAGSGGSDAAEARASAERHLLDVELDRRAAGIDTDDDV